MVSMHGSVVPLSMFFFKIARNNCCYLRVGWPHNDVGQQSRGFLRSKARGTWASKELENIFCLTCWHLQSQFVMLTAHMLYSSSCFESYVLFFVSVCFYAISFPSFCSCVFSLLFSLFVQLFSSCFFFFLPPKELFPTRTVSFMRLRSEQYLPGRSHFP